MSQRNQVITVAVLGMMLAGVLVYQMTRGTGAPPSDPGAAKTAAVGGSAPTTAGAAAKTATPGANVIRQSDVKLDELLANIKDIEFDYATQKVPRDCMVPLVGMVAQMTDPNALQNVPMASVGQILSKEVSGIVWDPVCPVAVVDNEVVYPGFEYADGTVITSIERDRVVFKVGDSPVEVKLKEL